LVKWNVQMTIHFILVWIECAALKLNLKRLP
jgi:hypothetical protein